MTTYPLADTIATSASLSSGAQVNGIDVVGLLMPAGWDAAVITLQHSPDGSAWVNIYDQNGAELTLQAAASRYIILPPSLLPGVGWLRIRSGTSGTPVTQTATRAFSWSTRNYGR